MKSRHGFIGGYEPKTRFDEEDDIIDQLGYEYYEEIEIEVDNPFEKEEEDFKALIKREEEMVKWVE